MSDVLKVVEEALADAILECDYSSKVSCRQTTHVRKALSLLPTLRAALAPVTDEEVAGIRERHEADGKTPVWEPDLAQALIQARTDRATLLRRDAQREAELGRLREVLKPFARFLDVRENMRGLTGTVDDADSSPMFECSSSVNGTATLTTGDFRRARAALEPKP